MIYEMRKMKLFSFILIALFNGCRFWLYALDVSSWITSIEVTFYISFSLFSDKFVS